MSVVITDGEITTISGKCEKCGVAKEEFKPVMGGMEVCMSCGYQRKLT